MSGATLARRDPDQDCEPPSVERFPPLNAPQWEQLAAPVVALLMVSRAASPRAIKTALQGRVSGDLVINVLAWLSLNERAYFDDRDGMWRLAEGGRS